MPFNIPNDSEWVTSVRGISTNDQLEGGPGGMMNNDAVDLTKRTNWLRDQIVNVVKKPIVEVASTRTVLASELRKFFVFRNTSIDNRIAFSPTVVAVNDTAGAVNTLLHTFFYDPPSHPDVTAVGFEYRQVGTTVWYSLAPGWVPPSGVFTHSGLANSVTFEFRIVSFGGSTTGLATSVFNTTTAPVYPITSATLPALADVQEGDWFAFENNELVASAQGRVFAAGSDTIVYPDGKGRNSFFVKPDAPTVFVVNLGGTWRLIGHNPAQAVGSIVHSAVGRPLRGYLPAHGLMVSRTTFSDLFAEIGSLYGSGDGSTTFTLPDTRAEFIRGWDAGRNVDPSRAFGSSQTDELKQHRHTINTTGVAAGSSAVAAIGTTSASGANVTGYTGGAETRPRNIAFRTWIKY